MKDIRRRVQDLDPEDASFDAHYAELSREVMDCLEGINDEQEKHWIEKGQHIVDGSHDEHSNEPKERNRALGYLKEAVHNVILREDNYRE